MHKYTLSLVDRSLGDFVNSVDPYYGKIDDAETGCHCHDTFKD